MFMMGEVSAMAKVLSHDHVREELQPSSKPPQKFVMRWSG
jgi:hypothetical protein